MANADLAAIAGMSDSAVTSATGWTWAEWVAALDAVETQLLSHRNIAELAATKFEADNRRNHRLRARNQKADGFALGASRVINAPLDTVYTEFAETLRISTAAKNLSIRIDGPDGGGIVVADFNSKSESKMQVAAGHSKVLDVGRRPAQWLAARDWLKKKLEV